MRAMLNLDAHGRTELTVLGQNDWALQCAIAEIQRHGLANFAISQDY